LAPLVFYSSIQYKLGKRLLVIGIPCLPDIDFELVANADASAINHPFLWSDLWLK